MARRQYCCRRMFLILAVLCIFLSLKPVLISAGTDKSTECETKGQELKQIIHLRRIQTGPKRRRTRRMMNVEGEINDYPRSGANNRHCPDC